MYYNTRAPSLQDRTTTKCDILLSAALCKTPGNF